jgi:hypothetical protein
MMLPVKTIMEDAHNLYRMSSNLRSIAYDLHHCAGSKNYRRQNKTTFSPELYTVALKNWMVYVLYIFNLYIYQKFLENWNNDFDISYYFNYEEYNRHIFVLAISVYMYNVYLVYSLLYNVGQSIIYFS